MVVTKYVLFEGSGNYPAPNDMVRVSYLCYPWHGQNQQSYREEKQIIISGDHGFKEFRIGDKIVPSGRLNEGISNMRPGERSMLVIPSGSAYGDNIVHLESITREKPSSGIYGCTFKGCFRLFGSFDSWVAHESKNHSVRQIWRCPVGIESGKECARLFERPQGFRQHLKQGHNLESEDAFVNICYLGDYQRRFWCGFCEKAYSMAEEGFVAIAGRHKHVGSHFENGQSITEWVDAGSHKPNWASASDGVFEVVGSPPFECAILKEGVISKARAIAC
ncbi:hypothetical protein H105_03003 [Trichophyton soudanense CBS 452.61]|uniref:C2H2-type domain-containing protein n=1 Tax=Trichophyton soudanense CBS 452.61 TaxID=1215331 RepID=A0A022XYR3_TRISD|nr:hypothetical protein H105_03003 [Trichophyton soudanense CBS 452.61]